MATRTTISRGMEAMYAALSRYPPEKEKAQAKEVWAAAFDTVPDEIFLDVLEEWCLHNDRLPTVSQMMERCQAARRAVPEPVALPGGPAPVQTYPVSSRRRVGGVLRRLVADAANAALIVETVIIPGDPPTSRIVVHSPDRHAGVHSLHDHGNADRCPACNRHDIDENGRHLPDCARCAMLARDRMMSVSALFDPDYEPGFEPETGEGEPHGAVLVSCKTCAGERFIAKPDGSVWPCPHCNPEAYARWSTKHYAAGHDCPSCSDVRRGIAPKASERITR